MANLGIAGSLLSRGDLVLEDRLNHASLLDAGLSSGAKLIRYRHADAAATDEALARRLSAPAQANERASASLPNGLRWTRRLRDNLHPSRLAP